MTDNEIFEVLKQNICEIVPEIENVKITIEDSLRDLGANSIDRAEIIMSTLESIKVSIPMVAFGEAKNINEIIQIIAAGLKKTIVNG
ncbi:acyl carrier protein [Bacillus atrophaeus]|uniref:Acyl carrier protein n=1 Tax=Bacillus subtilis TaxID=1423 RepID=A0A8I2BBA1_BACIU|nr:MULTISPECIES: acyl carrier protein [Bacillus]QQF64409.1 acyl carrier protein [Bacillus mojavensis]KUP31807.1 acyl carrier protein [Bacillus halotolerans]KUP39855.1 acyl carrier protein [Bacillus halotolerans]MBL4967534.1 acyl carrier protein [Bacillus halotolerans]MBL4971603.1 acyl carrier protein [Bacillus halotolerans]